MSEMMDQNSYVIQKAIAKGYYSDTDVMTNDNLQIAMGLIDLKDHSGELIYDGAYGNLVVYQRTMDQEGTGYVYEEL